MVDNINPETNLPYETIKIELGKNLLNYYNDFVNYIDKDGTKRLKFINELRDHGIEISGVTKEGYYLSFINSYLNILGISIPETSSLTVNNLINFIEELSYNFAEAYNSFDLAINKVLYDNISLPIVRTFSDYFNELESHVIINRSLLLSRILTYTLLYLGMLLIKNYFFGNKDSYEDAVTEVCNEDCFRKKIIKMITYGILEYLSDCTSNKYPGECYTVYHCIKEKNNKIILTDINLELVELGRQNNVDITNMKSCLIVFICEWLTNISMEYKISDNFNYDKNLNSNKYRFLDNVLDHVDITSIKNLGFTRLSDFVCQIINKYSDVIEEISLLSNDDMSSISFYNKKGIDHFDLITYKRLKMIL